MRNKTLTMLGVVLISILLSGCSQKTNELAGTHWELVSLNGKDLIKGTAITLEFTDTYLGGQMGCNGYGGSPDTGSYRAKTNGTFELISPFAVTVQLCSNPEGIMEQESEYIHTLMNGYRTKLQKKPCVIKSS
jgi:heat shock protein HslJ